MGKYKNIEDLPNKEQLDLLSEDDIDNMRTDVLTFREFVGDWKRYMDELEIYKDVRFKQSVIDMYNDWGEKVKEDPNSDFRVVGKVVNRLGAEKFYSVKLKSDLEEMGEFLYIKGIEPQFN